MLVHKHHFEYTYNSTLGKHLHFHVKYDHGSASLDELDEPSASLRIVLILSETPQGITVNKFYTKMKAFGVGRTSVDTLERRY